MALDFSALKKNRGNFDDLMQEVEKINTPSSEGRQKDERFWQPEVDKSGNGYAVIRFLPPPKGEDLPWARVWHHAFQSPSTGKWYIENSLTTLNKPDPVSEESRANDCLFLFLASCWLLATRRLIMV